MTDPDYDVVVSRINEIYNSSTKQEQQMLKQILGELAHSGYSYTYEQIFLNDFKEVPVGIDTFLDDPHYLGETNNYGKNVYPFWRKTIHDIFDNGNKYNEVILSGATRLGKSTTCTTMMAYMLYRLMLYRDPHQYFDKKAVSKFTLGFANLTKDLATAGCYREFNDTLKEVPWFMDHGRITRSDRNFYYLPEGDKIEIVPASSGEQLLGKQVWCLVGSTKIWTNDGIKSLSECCENNESVFQVTCGNDLITGSGLIYHTKDVTKTIRLTLIDGTIIEGTPDHMLMLSDGSYKTLEKINEDDDLMEVEEWRAIAGTTIYQVSNFGRVKRLKHTTQYTFYGDIHEQTFPERIFNITKGPDGYYTVDLQGLGLKRVHRLVAEAFIPNPENKLYVNHIDGNTMNNHASNLEWTTPQENTHHFWTADCFEEARKLHRQRQSVAQKGHVYHPRSEEARLRLSIANRAENLPLERRHKISEGLKGRVLSAESRAKIGEANRIANKGKRTVNDGVREYSIQECQLSEYLNNGYKLGRLSRIWVNNGNVETLVTVDKLPQLLVDGWKKGRL